MYTDPLTVTVNAVPITLPRTFSSVPGGPSTFTAADEAFKVEISHQIVKGKRERHLLKITQKAITANPFVPAENVESICSAYLVIDNPKQGFTDAELSDLVTGLTDFLGASTNLAKLIGGEA